MKYKVKIRAYKSCVRVVNLILFLVLTWKLSTTMASYPLPKLQYPPPEKAMILKYLSLFGLFSEFLKVQIS